MSHIITDQELMEELNLRFERSRKAFSDLSTVNMKLREINRRLEQSEGLKSNFLSNIRNEINNPLNAILGLASQVITLTAEIPEAVQLATTIHDEAFNLDFQLRNIFIAAELEAGAAQPVATLLNLDLLVTEILNSFSTRASCKQIRMTGATDVLSGDETPQIACDAEKLTLIISNLIANAIEFSHEGGAVAVSLVALDDGIHLQVSDTGIGIRKEDIPRIFDRFSQIESGSTRSHHGHGLGLSIIKALVELLEGRIEVISQPLRGTTVTVWLPRMQVEPGEECFGVGGNLFMFDSKLDEQ
jgi:signal transduction histidine kinase